MDRLPSASAPSLPSHDGTNLTDIFCSRVVTSEVGHCKQEFKVHENALIRLSRQFSVLLAGDTEEASEGRVVLEDCNPGTFASLLQFAYSSAFKNLDSTDQPLKQKRESEGNHGSIIAAVDNLFGNSNGTLPLRCKMEPQELLLVDFFYCHPEASTSSSHFEEIFDCERLFDFCESMVNRPCQLCDEIDDITFDLVHRRRLPDSPGRQDMDLWQQAELYVLAVKYDIPRLKRLCLFGLHDGLLSLRPSNTATMEIVKITRLLFENTFSQDGMRRLLVEFLVVGHNILGFMEDNHFQSLLSELPVIAVELFKTSVKLNEHAHRRTVIQEDIRDYWED